MTRVVIYGEYPPAAGPAVEATLASVRAHLAGGADVEVVSPRPSAAHHFADLSTVRGVAQLRRLAAGAELELTLDPALLADRGARGAPAQALLALVVSTARRSTVHLGALGGATGRGRVRLLLGRADAVTAASESDADALERAGVPRSRLSVRPMATRVSEPDRTRAGATPTGSDRAPWALSEQPEREELEAEVRRRAAEDRAAAAGGSPLVTRPLHLLGSFGPPPAASGKRLFAVTKVVVQQLTDWFVSPMVEHMNRLHEATMESIESHAALPDHVGDERVSTS